MAFLSLIPSLSLPLGYKKDLNLFVFFLNIPIFRARTLLFSRAHVRIGIVQSAMVARFKN